MMYCKILIILATLTFKGSMIIFGLNISILELILLSVLAITFFIQLFFYVFVYSRIKGKRKKTIVDQTEPVSIIICAKNEEENLKLNLPNILNQNYPDFEVIVVNDCSEDNSDIILEQMQRKYPRLKVTTIKPDEKFSHGKKLAMLLGIKAAKNDLLLMTDADCQPVSENWIRSMQRNYSQGIEITLGYGGYMKKKGFLNKLIRYDTVFAAMNYLGLATLGMPYMGVGRNLSYRKEMFFRNRGFASHSHIFSGDDDLFVNETANARNTAVELSPESITLSEPKHTFGEWIYQKRRHHTTWPLYKRLHRFVLGTEVVSRSVFHIGLLALFILNFNWIILLSIFALRLLIQLIIVKKALKHLNESDLLLFSLMFDIILPVIYIIVNFSNQFRRGKKNKWK